MHLLLFTLHQDLRNLNKINEKYDVHFLRKAPYFTEYVKNRRNTVIAQLKPTEASSILTSIGNSNNLLKHFTDIGL